MAAHWPHNGAMAPPSFDLSPSLGPGASQAVGGEPRTGSETPTGSEGGGPGIEPRQWQLRLIELLRTRLLNPIAGGDDLLVHAGPGAGKTLAALLGFQRLSAEGHLDRFLVFCHRSSIAAQWLQAAGRLGLDLREWDADGAATPNPLTANPLAAATPPAGLLLTYQGAARHRQLLERQLAAAGFGRWLAIADEVHHLGLDPDEPEAAAWGHAFSRLSQAAQLRLGLTGTPFRADNLAFCAARRQRLRQGEEVVEQIAADLSVEPRELIAAGDVRPLEFCFQDGWVDHGRYPLAAALETSPISSESRESWRARNLRRAIEPGDESSIALRLLLQGRSRLEELRQGHPQAAGLVIARDIAHARRITGLLEEQGDRVHLVHSQDPEAARRMAAFRAGEADWLVSIDMCAEGFDAPRLRVVTYLTTVVTRSRFVQAITRAVRVDGARASLEAIPRLPSYVYAPADPLLMGFARSWSLSEPYLIRQRSLPGEPLAGGSLAPSIPLEAIDDRPGELIRFRGPELPSFLPSARGPRR
jgi:superfamily II DNA or RNA helicase